MKQISRFLVGIIIVATITTLSAYTSTDALKYGAGTYGTCQYDTCSISIASNGTVILNTTPNIDGGHAIASDTTTVTTGSSTGYSLLLSMSGVDTILQGALHGGSIAAVSGSYSSPVNLAANTWGYRLDTGAFGTGPTSAQSDVGAPPALSFAAAPSSATPQQIVTTAAPANNHATNIWYGMFVSIQLPADTYNGNVTYTVLVN